MSDAPYWKDRANLHYQQMLRLENALARIAAGKRPDGTYNLSREACEQIAKEALADGTCDA